MTKKIQLTVALLGAFFMMHFACAQTLAFPGAEGFGRFATGGRYGTVYHVTTLRDSGRGSFRDAVSAPDRTIVFDIAGVINIKDKIKAAPRITIAGQTAPGEGVVVYGNGVSFSDSTIVRYMRFRGSINMPRGACTVAADNLTDAIFDHVTIEWGRWDNLHIKDSKNITMQYCLIGESLDPQRFGALFEGPTNVTIHHCLWIDNQSRNPKAKAGIEYINNVVYNWGKSGFVGGHSSAPHYQDIINNYFVAGPTSTDNFLAMFSNTDHVYHSGNYADLNKDGKLNGLIVSDSDIVRETAVLERAKQNNPSVAVKVESAADAFKTVLIEAGASLKRDAVDQRVVGYAATMGKAGQIFKTEAEAGGQPPIAAVRGEKDTDGDGIPDVWEKKNKLDPSNAKDASKIAADGYSNLETYINSLAVKRKEMHRL